MRPDPRLHHTQSPGVGLSPAGDGHRQSAGARDLAARGWASRLAAWIAACVIVESLTGLWIWLAPFSINAQLQVLLHTILGLLMVVPYVWYQVRHFLTWYRQRLTAVMLLGYCLMLMMVACSVSGLVLTWQSAFGLKRSEAWDLVHLVTGVAAFGLIAAHLALAWSRRRGAAAAAPDFARGVRRFVRAVPAWTLGAALPIAVGAAFLRERPIERPVPEGYGLPRYAQAFDEYRGNPFAPTYARTASGNLVDPDVLAHSESCGSSRCHEQILAEWLPSAHRFSAMNPPFQQVQKAFAADREPAETRYCAGCHDPISLFAGAKDIQNLSLSAPGMQEGSSCVVCHSISKVDQRGNADYVLTPPRKYLWEHEEDWRKLVSDFLIRAYPRQHLADYDRNVLRTPEFCGACHKQFIPEALNRFGVSPAQNQYDEWRKGHWHVEDPAADLSCRDCHMRLVRESRDPGRGEEGDVRRSADDGAHRHHGVIATNMFMPAVLKLPHWEEQVRLSEEWIRGETVIPEIDGPWPRGPVASVDIVAPATARAGEEVMLRTVVKNRKAGHNFTTGPLDFMQSWVHLRVTDVGGRTIAEWGALDPETRYIYDAPGRVHEPGDPRPNGALVLEGMPVDEAGELLKRHELWKKAGGRGQRVIFPGYSDSQVHRFIVPRGTRGPLTVTAGLNFRRYRQEFLELVVPTLEKESGFPQPIVLKDSDEKQIVLEPGPPPALSARDLGSRP